MMYPETSARYRTVEPSNGSNVISRRARPGLSGLGPHSPRIPRRALPTTGNGSSVDHTPIDVREQHVVPDYASRSTGKPVNHASQSTDKPVNHASQSTGKPVNYASQSTGVQVAAAGLVSRSGLPARESVCKRERECVCVREGVCERERV